MGWRTLTITLCTSFLLGVTFTHWIADHNTLWTTPVTPAAISISISYYTILGNADTALYWGWGLVAATALIAAGWRVGRGLGGVKGGEGGGWLFDGGSLVLLLAVIWTQISDVQLAVQNLTQATALHPIPSLAQMEQSEILVKGLAGSNVFISVGLTGVWLLQCGRYYSERSDKKAALQRVQDEQSRRASSSSKTTKTTKTTKPTSQATANAIPVRVGTPFRELTQEEAMGLLDDVDVDVDVDAGAKKLEMNGNAKVGKRGNKVGSLPGKRR